MGRGAVKGEPMSLKIVAIAMAYNEGDIVAETVRQTLGWADDFVILDHGSTDDTAELAYQAGALVMHSERSEFHEGLRQPTLESAQGLGADWVVRVDIDEQYWLIDDGQAVHPRAAIEHAHEAGASCVRALQAEFWITLDDVRRGLILEKETIPVLKRRRWYTIGHTALIAWRNHPDLKYYQDKDVQKRHNVPLWPDRAPVNARGFVWKERPLQLHFNSRSIRQLMGRMGHRVHNTWIFGKYRYNVIIDEQIGLHYLGPDDRFCFRDNHRVVYDWYEKSTGLQDERSEVFGW